MGKHHPHIQTQKKHLAYISPKQLSAQNEAVSRKVSGNATDRKVLVIPVEKNDVQRHSKQFQQGLFMFVHHRRQPDHGMRCDAMKFMEHDFLIVVIVIEDRVAGRFPRCIHQCGNELIREGEFPGDQDQQEGLFFSSFLRRTADETAFSLMPVDHSPVFQLFQSLANGHGADAELPAQFILTGQEIAVLSMFDQGQQMVENFILQNSHFAPRRFICGYSAGSVPKASGFRVFP